MSEFDTELEAQLKRELRRVDAPVGFADRVMGRLEAQVKDEGKQRLVVMQRGFFWMAVAAMLLVGIILGGWQWQQRNRRQRQEAELARRQFELAMQVTGRMLLDVQQQIGRAGQVHSSGRKQEVQ